MQGLMAYDPMQPGAGQECRPDEGPQAKAVEGVGTGQTLEYQLTFLFLEAQPRPYLFRPTAGCQVYRSTIAGHSTVTDSTFVLYHWLCLTVKDTIDHNYIGHN